MGVLVCLRESGLVGMGAMFGGDVIQSRTRGYEQSFLVDKVVQSIPNLYSAKHRCSLMAVCGGFVKFQLQPIVITI